MSDKLLKIGFIGGGKMAQAMAKGFIKTGLSQGSSMIASCHPSDHLAVNSFKELGASTTFENTKVVEGSDIVIIATKPTVVSSALADIKIKEIRADKLFLSIAMGITIKQLEQILPQEARVIRAMPNIPALVRNAASVFVSGKNATKDDGRVTKRLLESIGTCEEVPESYIDPITALSGSGPAYVYLMIEALADGGVKMGLPRDLAYRLASQTVLGAGQMVRDTKTHPGVLKDDVSSPSGSTAYGLHYLEEKGLRGAVIGAVEAATKHCRKVSSKCENR
ncbi:pyrroline-5-carboxylate reductase 3 isoform X1 [Diorhabda sublineata]|uniref:pyrroline-5-carboxylate reductase 3 isoform X1 n=1 Tax=Diorhabda sublineata TaxID=1163346 RepID=UPI0024E0A6EC|nr:pyrroline-5-carboxylate reductase 3 isoform X1 [Diorhabda sublineata]